MLYTLTFRVFLLSVTTSASITALEAFKKIYTLQTCTRGVMDGAPGIFGFFSCFASMHLPAVYAYMRVAEPKAVAMRGRTPMGY